MTTTTNIYPIKNLQHLSFKYRTYKVEGIPSDLDNYYSVITSMGHSLSKFSHSPCIVQSNGNSLVILQPYGHDTLPSAFTIVGAQPLITPLEGVKELNLSAVNQDNIELALRFLQFVTLGQLKANPLFWVPTSGASIYNKVPDQQLIGYSNSVSVYKGFNLRFMALPGNGIGLCVDVSSKYVDSRPLPAIISRDDFRKYKGRNCVYEYGDTWYQVRIEGLLDINVSKAMLPDGSTLYQHIQSLKSCRSTNLINSLPRDCSVLTYHTSKGEVRQIPSALCRLAYKTNSKVVSQYHRYTLLSPNQRRDEIKYVVNNYLRRLLFEGNYIELADKPIEFENKPFKVPSMLFGNGKIIDLDNGDLDGPLGELAFKKKQTLFSADAGFWSKGQPLYPQYLVLPQSFYDAVGNSFIIALKEQFKLMYSPTGEYGYNPTLILYNDNVGRSVPVLGKEILRSVRKSIFYSGYGLVVIPRLSQTFDNTEDELANLLMRELRSKDIYVSIMHTEHAFQAYSSYVSSDGTRKYELTRDFKQRKRYNSYLQNVVLNKILLLESHWPFVLAKPLHADLTIGIDVKNNTAGFTFILKDGKTIWTTCNDSKYRERIGQSQCSSIIFKQLEKSLNSNSPIKSIAIHRDGRTFPEEEEGLREGLNKLLTKGLIHPDYDLNIIELHKMSSVPVRFFERSSVPGSQLVAISNPKIGTHLTLFDRTYLATTGLPYHFKGTAKPIQLIRTAGKMPMDDLCEDLFSLCNLTWTRIDDCSRVPISIKMTDIRLREVAGDYNRDAIQFDTEEEEI